MSGYKVISQHGTSTRVRSRKFATAEEADAYAATISPEADGTTIPNIDAPILDRAMTKDEGPGCYSRGYFWLGNRYAAALEA
jgi:hypothetical protein